MSECSVFWDLEQCSVPSGLRGFEVYKRLQQLVAKKFNGRLVHTVAIGRAEGSNAEIKRDLIDIGVQFLEVTSSKPSSFDIAFLGELMRLVCSAKPAQTIILVVGDRDYAKFVTILEASLHKVVILAVSTTPASVRYVASETLEWGDVLNDKALPATSSYFPSASSSSAHSPAFGGPAPISFSPASPSPTFSAKPQAPAPSPSAAFTFTGSSSSVPTPASPSAAPFASSNGPLSSVAAPSFLHSASNSFPSPSAAERAIPSSPTTSSTPSASERSIPSSAPSSAPTTPSPAPKQQSVVSATSSAPVASAAKPEAKEAPAAKKDDVVTPKKDDVNSTPKKDDGGASSSATTPKKDTPAATAKKDDAAKQTKKDKQANRWLPLLQVLADGKQHLASTFPAAITPALFGYTKWPQVVSSAVNEGIVTHKAKGNDFGFTISQKGAKILSEANIKNNQTTSGKAPAASATPATSAESTFKQNPSVKAKFGVPTEQQAQEAKATYSWKEPLDMMLHDLKEDFILPTEAVIRSMIQPYSVSEKAFEEMMRDAKNIGYIVLGNPGERKIFPPAGHFSGVDLANPDPNRLSPDLCEQLESWLVETHTPTTSWPGGPYEFASYLKSDHPNSKISELRLGLLLEQAQILVAKGIVSCADDGSIQLEPKVEKKKKKVKKEEKTESGKEDGTPKSKKEAKSASPAPSVHPTKEKEGTSSPVPKTSIPSATAPSSTAADAKSALSSLSNENNAQSPAVPSSALEHK